MSGKKPYASIRDYGRDLSEMAEDLAPGFDMEKIHDFRRTTKKLRALMRWLRKDKPLKKAFKRLYHLSGEMRNSQVLLARLEKENELPSFRSWLDARLSRLERQWLLTYKSSTLQKQSSAIRDKRSKKATRKGLERFTREKTGRIRSILAIASIPDEDLHEGRKMLKDLQYVYEWAEKKKVVAEPGAMIDTLKRIGHQAGQFNDQRIALLLITAYLREEKDSLKRRAAVQKKKEWKKIKMEQKRALKDALARFIQ